MGNYCNQKVELTQQNPLRKVSIASNSTTISQLDSVDSMRKESSKLLKFLQEQNSSSLGVLNSYIEDIEVVSELGKGGQSKVFQIHIKGPKLNITNDFQDSLEKIAVKRTNLKKQRNNISSLLISKKLMDQNDCPFLMSGLFSFQSQKYFYSGMPVAEGGDLTSFFQRWRGKGDAFRKLGEVGIRMVLAGIVIGLQYLHQRNYIYCDLKVDNVLIDKKGYPLLADFQLMSDKNQIPRNQIRGTVTSLGPEIHFEQTIDKGIDIWALGVLLYILIYNQTPFDQSDIVNPQYPQICKNNQNLYHEGKKQVSDQLANLLNSLLKCNRKERIGYQRTSDIKQHNFFEGFDWQKYVKKQLDNPLQQIVQKFPIKSATRRKTTFPQIRKTESQFPSLMKSRKSFN